MNNFRLLRVKFFFKSYIRPVLRLFEESNVSNNKITFILVLTILGSCFEALFILLLAPFTNSVLNNNQTETSNLDIFSSTFNSPFLLLLLIIFSLFVKSSTNTYKTYFVTKVIFIIRKQLRLKLIYSVLDTSWKTKLEGGKLLDAYINSSTIATQTILVLTEIITNFLYVVAILSTFFYQVSLDMVIVFLFLGIFYYLIIYFLSKKGRNLSFINLETNQNLSQLATEVVRGSRELQIYGNQKIILNQMSYQEDKLVKNQSMSSLLLKIPSILPSFLITIIVIYGYFTKGTDNISSNSPIIVTSLIAVQRLGVYLSIIGQKLTTIGAGSAEINLILKEIKHKSSTSGKKIIINNKNINSININKLTFNYGNKKDLLNDLNLEFLSGKVSLIIGPSGSGKSSLFSLLLKECNPLEGDIRINDYSLENISKYSWYENLSLVSQAPFIFGTSILNNIKIGKSDATFREVINACKDSGAFEYINKLSDKFEFNVSDGGTNLSGGQCQLISLTRAILKNAPIIFLDEPSNNLDNKSVTNLKKLLLSWAKNNKLVLVITHDQRLIDKRFDVYKIEDFNLFKQINT